MKETIIAILATAIITFVIIAGFNALSHEQCRSNVQEMGREYRYSLIQGCRVGLEDGTFIYWKMYREVDD